MLLSLHNWCGSTYYNKQFWHIPCLFVYSIMVPLPSRKLVWYNIFNEAVLKDTLLRCRLSRPIDSYIVSWLLLAARNFCGTTYYNEAKQNIQLWIFKFIKCTSDLILYHGCYGHYATGGTSFYNEVVLFEIQFIKAYWFLYSIMVAINITQLVWYNILNEAMLIYTLLEVSVSKAYWLLYSILIAINIALLARYSTLNEAVLNILF